jgi:hypothetical protein
MEPCVTFYGERKINGCDIGKKKKSKEDVR